MRDVMWREGSETAAVAMIGPPAVIWSARTWTCGMDRFDLLSFVTWLELVKHPLLWWDRGVSVPLWWFYSSFIQGSGCGWGGQTSGKPEVWTSVSGVINPVTSGYKAEFTQAAGTERTTLNQIKQMFDQQGSSPPYWSCGTSWGLRIRAAAEQNRGFWWDLDNIPLLLLYTFMITTPLSTESNVFHVIFSGLRNTENISVEC